MSKINPLARELTLKIVYYGPGLSGKTTSLKDIHARVRPESRGELLSLATEGDRTLFFDYLPVFLERVNDLPVRLQLYTVPGQVFYDATRKLVLNGVDGVVFVADSQRGAMDANLEALDNLSGHLADLGLELARMPLVFQFNKRDLPEAMPLAEMHQALNLYGAPEFETAAARGQGVFPAFKQIVRLTLDQLKKSKPGVPAAELDLSAGPSPSPPAELPPVTPVAGGITFRALVEPHGAALARIEHAIATREFGMAVSTAAGFVAEVLAALPPRDVPTASKVALLGLEGREYLRLARLVGQPDGALHERDALFALYLAVAAAVKVGAL